MRLADPVRAQAEDGVIQPRKFFPGPRVPTNGPKGGIGVHGPQVVHDLLSWALWWLESMLYDGYGKNFTGMLLVAGYLARFLVSVFSGAIKLMKDHNTPMNVHEVLDMQI